MKALQAQKLRNQVKGINAEIELLENKREGLTGSEKGKVTREINEWLEVRDGIEASLKEHGMVKPLPPKYIASRIVKFLKAVQDEYEETVEAFNKRAGEWVFGLENAIEWYGGPVAKTTAIYRAFAEAHALDILEQEEATVPVLLKHAQAGIASVRETQERSLTHIGGSTNAFANALEVAAVEGRAKWLRWDASYFESEWEMLEPAWNAYLDLANACEVTGIALEDVAPELVAD